ncbi:hypothetical protein OZ411_08935 [Bradyrhizobium sp. Arg237L]|uniref:hypothetical protein n=1 Tax=Bradyrhizobium sp. Arg237L TaxID=3003352 RepID=UPI00249EFA64|nr:hypothetical protein [Bradyrhizobium sp. Arg237L]MDI4232935.1 hypothetical protein [Bradyrhizobium sp. Arg237L]
MPTSARPLATLFALALTGCALGGCGTVNEKLSAGTADLIPAWAGGLPADAPPRPGTAKYDEFMRERERKRMMPAAERGDDNKPAPTSQDTAH